VRIHIIEGNHNLRSLLAWHLHQVGYQVQQSPTLARAYQLCESGLPTLAVIDSDLPDGEGIEFCRWLYPQNTSAMLMLSARIREIDVVTALEAGVDDYLKKPFGLPEFLARVAALLRRERLVNSIPSDLTLGNIRIDLVRRCVFIHDKSALCARASQRSTRPPPRTAQTSMGYRCRQSTHGRFAYPLAPQKARTARSD
jgi:two-component system, OmpR family, response regulator